MVFPIFGYGLLDGLNPFGLAIIGFFLLFVKFVVNSAMEFKVAGMLFILSAATSIYLNSIGMYDAIFVRTQFLFYLHQAYGALGVIFCIFAIVYFLDWLRLRKGSTSKLIVGVPKCIKRPISASKSKAITASLVGIGLGFASAFISTAWPQDYFLFVNLFSLFSEGKTWLVFGLLWVYCLGYVFLVFLIWLFGAIILSVHRLRLKVLQSASLLQIIFSAFFVSIGLGLIFTYFQS